MKLESSVGTAPTSNNRKCRRKRKYSYQCREISSFKVFMQFVCYVVDPATGKRICDATEILSKGCYKQWLASRRTFPKKPEEAFRRALTAHCRGVDGRRPFAEEVEASLLSELRKKRQWRCFEGTTDCGSIGVQGFPSLGFHEKKKNPECEELSDISSSRSNGEPEESERSQPEEKISLKKQELNSYVPQQFQPFRYDFPSVPMGGYADVMEMYDPFGTASEMYAASAANMFYPRQVQAEPIAASVSQKKMKLEREPIVDENNGPGRRNSAVLAEMCVNHLTYYEQPPSEFFVY